MFKRPNILIFSIAIPILFFSIKQPVNSEQVNIDSYYTEQSKQVDDILPEMTEEDLKFLNLDWKESGEYKFSGSNSILSIPEGYLLLIEEEAKTEREMNGNFDNEFIEAVVWDKSFENVITFENIENGYVTIDDWKEIDSNSLINEISENTEKSNLERKKRGFAEIHVIGWIQEPTFDKEKNTVYWVVEGLDDDDGISFVNSVALRLGRKGYERIVWITSKESFIPSNGHLDVMINAHNFESGYRYEDFKSGDKVAGYGIAALVAATAGGKIVKGVGFIAFFKKIGGFIVAAIAYLFHKIKGIFKNQEGTNETQF